MLGTLELSNTGISSFDAILHNYFKITKVTAAQSPDLSSDFESFKTPVPSKPVLKITFETIEKSKAFQSDIRGKLNSNTLGSPILGVTIYLGVPLVILKIQCNLGATTLVEQFAPALAFLNEHYPGFDFEGSVSAQLAAEPSSSNPPITPARDASRRISAPGSMPAPDTMCAATSACLML